jgi:vacuolar-type H+-ATPase subunit D/Vma8
MKNKLKGAETGHSLLKKKSEALTKCVLSLLEAMHHRADRTPSLRRFRGKR